MRSPPGTSTFAPRMLRRLLQSTGAHLDQRVEALVAVLFVHAVEQLQQAAAAQAKRRQSWVRMQPGFVPGNTEAVEQRQQAAAASNRTGAQQKKSAARYAKLSSPNIRGDGAHHAEIVVDQAAARLRIHRNVACMR